MKDWKTRWARPAIVLLAGVVLFQFVTLHEMESLYRREVQLLHQEIDKVKADALKTRLDNSAQFMVQMNCAQVGTTLKQWNACVIKGLQAAFDVCL